MSLYDDALWIITPNQYVSGSLYALKPIDSSGDLFIERSSYANRVDSNGYLDYVSDNVPRLDYSNGSCPEILIEPQRTNILLYSEDFTDIRWQFFSSIGTITPGYAESPSGFNNAARIQFPDGSSDFGQSIVVTPGTYRTFSIYLKGTAGETINIGFGGGTSSLKTLTGEWDRFNISGTDGIYVWIGTWGGATARDLLIYGAQCEVNKNMTSYIPTTDKTVTRIYDNIRNINTSSLIGQNEGTFYFELDVVDYANSGNPVLYYINNNSSTNLTYAQINEAGFVEFVSPNYYLYWGGLTNGKHKIAVAHTTGDAVLYVDGVKKDFKDYAYISNVYDIFGLGYTNPSFIGKTFFGNIMFLPERISDIELAQLTTL